MSDWAPILDVDTPASSLPLIVDRLVEESLDELRAAMAADPELTDNDRQRGEAVATTFLRERTTAVVERAWTDLQIAAGKVN